MAASKSEFSVNLFYSYSHKDDRHRTDMEKVLALLKQNGLLRTWSDRSITAGQSISQKIKEAMGQADIIVFLLSPDFIASDACRQEWKHAKSIAGSNKLLVRIPVIVRDCVWREFLGEEDLLALPNDGQPVIGFGNQDTAWLEVHEGIRNAIEGLRSTFEPKQAFLQEMEETEFLAAERVPLSSIFVFPTLTNYSELGKDVQGPGVDMHHENDFLNAKMALVHGAHLSGKSALVKHIFRHLVERVKPVLFVDLQSLVGRLNLETLSTAYANQFSGDYRLWVRGEDKTLIVDNLSQAGKHLEFLSMVRKHFDRIIVTVSSDIFYSYYRDDERLADFQEIKIGPMTHSRQESLIRKRAQISAGGTPVPDGRVDHIEQKINAVVISNKIVPRYPFYVLTIMQTYESFMPSDFSITAYGHCYYALILANLIKAGVSRTDADINSCFNFAEHLAFDHYLHTERGEGSAFDFNAFMERYRARFHIDKRLINRMKSDDYGIIAANGCFRSPYMLHFFLGRHLAKPNEKHREIIERMCDQITLRSNYLTLLFLIHHTQDDSVVEDIVLRTMTTLDSLPPARLDKQETKRFQGMLENLPNDILSNRTVEEERSVERDARDAAERDDQLEDDSVEDSGLINDCYRILKSNEVLGQVLRNKHGSLEKVQVEDIIEAVADSGLRLVSLSISDEREIQELAKYLHAKHPEYSIVMLSDALRRLAFIWTMVNIEKIVASINHPDLREMLGNVVSRKDTPAYDLIGCFSRLDMMEKLSKSFPKELKSLINKHKDPFLKNVLSLRTRRYISTHRSEVQVEQAICSIIGVKYRPRLR